MCECVCIYIPIYVPLFLSVSSWGLLAISFFNLLRMRTADVHKREEGRMDGWRREGWMEEGGREGREIMNQLKSIIKDLMNLPLLSAALISMSSIGSYSSGSRLKSSVICACACVRRGRDMLTDTYKLLMSQRSKVKTITFHL